VDGLEIIGIGGVGKALHGPGCCWPQGIARQLLEEEEAGSLIADFRKKTRQRYLDKSAERGIAALHGSIEATGLAQVELDAAPERVGLLIATCCGPDSTRAAYLSSYLSRGRSSVSATFFTNCGFNITGAMMARSRNIRGPVLTLIPDRNPGQALVEMAQLLFASKRMDLAFLAHADNDNGIVLCVRPAKDARCSDASIGGIIEAFL
jgi:3-oxoacyl-(acyl-carrier-protein) synthase